MSENLIQISSSSPKKKNAEGSARELSQSDKLKVYIKTFGCQMNVYDTEKLLTILEKEYDPVDSPEEANLVIVNTCSVRDKPEQKLYSLLGELKPYKERGREFLIGVGGCVAQQEGKNITARSKAVDFVFGTHNLSLVPALIRDRRAGKDPQVAVDYRDEWEELPLGLTNNGRVSVFVSISRGCNKNCTYCIVPTTRGEEVSRPLDEIKREVRLALHRGAKEIVLLGQTVNSYGRDLTPRIKFTELLQSLSEYPELKRIRFTSPHPQEVREDFYDLVSLNDKVCRHIHMPLQAGSDRILKLMNRNYRKDRFRKIIAGLKERAPDIAISTDIIVGFPGETRAEFEETLELLKEIEFDSSYSFVFSPRPGTPAADMDDPVPYQEKLAWLQELQAAQFEITSRKLDGYVGQTLEVLVDGPSQADSRQLQGRTTHNVVVNLLGDCSRLSPGLVLPVSITGRAKYTLKGEVSADWSEVSAA